FLESFAHRKGLHRPLRLLPLERSRRSPRSLAPRAVHSGRVSTTLYRQAAAEKRAGEGAERGMAARARTRATKQTDPAGALRSLRSTYGAPPPPLVTDPFEMILWENVAYLLSDERRAEAFDLLRRRVGTTPRTIRDADRGDLFAVAERGGMRPVERVARLRAIADLALEEAGGGPGAAPPPGGPPRRAEGPPAVPPRRRAARRENLA